MDTGREIAPLIVVLGQTASGKTKLAMHLAKKFNGEIVSADSRAVYRGMDIGTAKPNQRDRRLIGHHVIDITEPDRPINAADFKKLALKSINAIWQKGKIPIMVGGSGLYIDSVIFDFQFNKPSSAIGRKELDKLSVSALQSRIREAGLDMPSNDKNKRHLTRRLESGHNSQENKTLRANTLLIGIRLDKEELKKNVAKRVKTMMSEGLEKEVAGLVEQYGWKVEPLRTIGYKEFEPYFAGQQDLATIQVEIERQTIRYAKRQHTWFKRNKNIHWVEKQIQAVDLVTTFLNK